MTLGRIFCVGINAKYISSEDNTISLVYQLELYPDQSDDYSKLKQTFLQLGGNSIIDKASVHFTMPKLA